MLTPDLINQLNIISAYMGNQLTDEQMEFASDFRRNIISFSDPGTGKTHTLVAGLAMAQKYYNIPGNLIDCMSFTNASILEIKARYDHVCKRASIPKNVVFNTFHSLSRQIMNEAYPTIKIVDKIKLDDALKDVKRYMSEVGLDTDDMNFAKKIYYCINKLNSALSFHSDEIERSYSFQELGISVGQFQDIRRKWFMRSIIEGKVVQGDIPLYCLYALLTKTEIIPKWKGKFKIMIVDEFQDLSLLHLHILSIISTTLIVVGDMKQQIYAFNGACPQIVNEYRRLHPDAAIRNLTKSFRCKQNIADFASKLIAPNDRSVIPFTGIAEGGSVQIIPRRELDWVKIAESIKDDISAHKLSGARNVMFLYRNNASALPIMEQLYKLDVPFRNPKFARVMDIPIFKELCILANAAWQPKDINYVTEALRLFPEFSGLGWEQTIPPITVMEHTGKSLFEIKYKWKEQSSIDILIAMQVAKNKMLEHKSAGVVLNNLLEMYDRYIIKGKWWTLDNTKEFYFNLVAPICNSKEYPVMFEEENDKMNKNMESYKMNIGVRCYTIHSAKGLEADDVYLLDCDEGLFPNIKTFERKVKAGCYYDAACDIRAERNLLYVAVTRAKDNVIISYSGEKPAELLVNPENNQYREFDTIYEEEQINFDNVGAFCELLNIETEDEAKQEVVNE